MPKYKIQLKQGKRTVVAHGEFKSVASVLAHYNHISTMKVSEILEVKFEDESQPPIDDFMYRSLFKGILKNDATRKSKQVIFNNIKMTINEREVIDSCKMHMEIDSSMVDSAITSLFKT